MDKIKELEDALESEELYQASNCKKLAPLLEFHGKYNKFPHETLSEAARAHLTTLKAGDNREALSENLFQVFVKNFKGTVNHRHVTAMMAVSDYVSALTSGHKEGWVLVPREPTDEMIEAGIMECMAVMYGGVKKNLKEGMVASISFSCVQEYKAMIAAAPKTED